LLLVIVLVRVLKWQALVRIALPGAGFRECLKSYLAALPYGLITPGRFGELMRLAYLPPLEGATCVERDWLLSTACSILHLFFGPRPSVSGSWEVPRWGWRRSPSGWPDLPLLVAEAVVHCSTSVAGALGLRGLALPAESLPFQLILYLQALGILAHLAVGMQYVLVMDALSVAPIPWLDVVGVMSVVTLINTIPITIAGLGVREGLAVIFLARWGIPAGVAGWVRLPRSRWTAACYPLPG